jgi:hypothetical protein
MAAPPPTSSSDAPPGPDPNGSATGEVRCEEVDGAVVLSVSGPLDDAAGRSLVAALQSTVADPPPRVDIDLAEVCGFTTAGAAALGECRSYADHLPGGLHYRTVQGPGQDAFLAAFE